MVVLNGGRIGEPAFTDSLDWAAAAKVIMAALATIMMISSCTGAHAGRKLEAMTKMHVPNRLAW